MIIPDRIFSPWHDDRPLYATFSLCFAAALQVGRIDLATRIEGGSGEVIGRRGKTYVRSSLVLVQVALSFLSLTETAQLFAAREIQNTSRV